jgi:hypothetical protein
MEVINQEDRLTTATSVGAARPPGVRRREFITLLGGAAVSGHRDRRPKNVKVPGEVVTQGRQPRFVLPGIFESRPPLL